MAAAAHFSSTNESLSNTIDTSELHLLKCWGVNLELGSKCPVPNRALLVSG